MRLQLRLHGRRRLNEAGADAAPVLMRRLREGWPETIHRGCLAVASPAMALAIGPVRRAVFPRSAIKPIHALPLLTSGAFDRFGLAAEHLALACGSSAGDPAHRPVLQAWLERLDLPVSTLACGVESPRGRGPTGREPDALDNNNAGKHLAMLSVVRHFGEPVESYCHADHPAQERLRAIEAKMCGVSPQSEGPRLAEDNCGARTQALPVAALAAGMARLAGGLPDETERAGASRRLLDAVGQAPWFFAGRARFSSRLLAETGGRILAKGGTGGVFCALDRVSGEGLALKIEDGSAPVASRVLVAAMARRGWIDAALAGRLSNDLDARLGPEPDGRRLRPDFPALAQLPGGERGLLPVASGA